MRVFTAIKIPPDARKTIGDFVVVHSTQIRELKWVKTENLHVTLKFMGERTEEEIGKIKELIREVAGEFSGFHVTISGVDCFPDISKPRVLWAGVGEGAEILKNLEKKLSENVETPHFVPHVTIARMKHLRPDGYNKLKKLLLIDSNHGFGRFHADGISLFSSMLKPGGAVYEELFFAAFKK